MELGYHEKNGNEFITEKFSVFKNHKCGCVIEDFEGSKIFNSYDSYEPFTSDKKECKQFMTDACEHLKRLGYDTVEPVFHYCDCGDYNLDEYGFFLVKDDVIVKFVDFSYAEGFLSAIKLIEGGVL